MMTAAQRQYIASVRDEADARKKGADGPIMTRDEWQQVTDANRQNGVHSTDIPVPPA